LEIVLGFFYLVYVEEAIFLSNLFDTNNLNKD